MTPPEILRPEMREQHADDGAHVDKRRHELLRRRGHAPADLRFPVPVAVDTEETGHGLEAGYGGGVVSVREGLLLS